MIETDIPLFPLHTVLFPDGYLKLRIFEQRYIDMVRECSLKASCFGVCLINNPEDSNRPANHMRVGTTAEICDFSTLDDGLLGITAHGRQKFIINKFFTVFRWLGIYDRTNKLVKGNSVFNHG